MFKHSSFDRFKRSMSKVSFVTALVLVISSVVQTPSFAQAAKDNQTAICHSLGNGNYIVIEPNNNSVLQAHLDHGDFLLPESGNCGGQNSGNEDVVDQNVCLMSNIVTNGSFETPDVPGGWNIYAGDGVAVPGWTSEWESGSGDGFEPSIEIHGGVNGWDAQDGSQYVELDGDTEGPAGQTSGEPASTKISQTLLTVPGASYNVSFWTSARPGVEDNEVEFSWDGGVEDNISQDGSSLSDTSWEMWSGVLTADSIETVISFADKSDADSLGSFVDNVVVTPICGSITAHKFNDLNADGVVGEGEEALSGWRIYLDLDGDNVWDEGTEPSEVTDGDGIAQFDNLYSGNYTVREVWQDGWIQTSPSEEADYEHNVTVGIQSIINIWFGNQQGVTIRAHKIVCHEESYLPNWGGGASNIDENTASDFVADSDGHCWMQEGWNFQWGPQNSYDPGDVLVGEAGEPWNTFGSTDANGLATAFLTAEQVGNNQHLWFREVLQEGYIPFTHDQNGNTNANDVSAEVYCHSDVLNYDNYDRIDGVEVGGVYDCVAFNVAEPETEICEFDEDDEGWYGRYYNYEATHPDMNLDPSLWPDKTHGDPQNYITNWDTDWYDAQYFVEAQVDSDLNFGAFFPLDFMGNDTGNHNYHFGVHWTAMVDAPVAGNYNYNLTSDDDVWVYVNDILVSVGSADASGIHAPTAFPGTVFFNEGNNKVDIYFAERHVVDSWMSFAFENQDLNIMPWNEDCEDNQGGYITGQKWNDEDGDGFLDEGEPAIGGWFIWVDLNDNGVYDDGTDIYTYTGDDDAVADPNESTDVLGRYNFYIPMDGTFSVHEGSVSGWEQTYPDTEAGYYEITVSDGEAVDFNYDFGNHYTGNGDNTCERFIYGSVFHDVNSDTNFVLGDGDAGLQTWTVYVDLDNDNVWDEGTEPSDETDVDGYFSILVDAPGSYTVRQVTQSGWTLIYPTEGDEGEYLVTLDCFAKEVEIESDVLVQMLDVFVQAIESDGFENLRFANVISDDSSDDNGGGGSSSGSRSNNDSGDGSSGDNGEVLGEQVAADTLPVTGLGGIYLVLMIVMGLGLSFLLPKKELE